MKALLVFMLVVSIMRSQIPSAFKPGRFFEGYSKKEKGISIEIRRVQDGPRCRHFDNCPWVILWTADKRSQEAFIEVTLAGMDFPVVRAWVPGAKDAPRDKHNPVFSGEDAPLKSVTQIEITLRNGTKEVRHAVFR
jgi:hypothetical protein